MPLDYINVIQGVLTGAPIAIFGLGIATGVLTDVAPLPYSQEPQYYENSQGVWVSGPTQEIDGKLTTVHCNLISAKCLKAGG